MIKLIYKNTERVIMIMFWDLYLKMSYVMQLFSVVELVPPQKVFSFGDQRIPVYCLFITRQTNPDIEGQ